MYLLLWIDVVYHTPYMDDAACDYECLVGKSKDPEERRFNSGTSVPTVTIHHPPYTHTDTHTQTQTHMFATCVESTKHDPRYNIRKTADKHTHTHTPPPHTPSQNKPMNGSI